MKRFYSSDYLISNIKEVAEITPFLYWKEGEEWYNTANKIAEDIAKRYNKHPTIVQGVMSALSVMQSWNTNIIITDLYFQGIHKHTGTQIEKCKLIEESTSLEEINTILNGNKTVAFFNCINNPLNNEYVVIDRHNLKIAGILEDSINSVQYKFVENCYKAVAEEFKVRGNTLQAATWIYFREAKKLNKKKHAKQVGIKKS